MKSQDLPAILLKVRKAFRLRFRQNSFRYRPFSLIQILYLSKNLPLPPLAHGS
jgi:hypothetical protein